LYQYDLVNLKKIAPSFNENFLITLRKVQPGKISDLRESLTLAYATVATV
jgi:hypothetical protein